VKDFSMPEKLWGLANLVTGFAVLQTLATTFALVKGELSVLEGLTAHWSAFAVTIIFSALYFTAIIWCWDVGSSLDKPENLHIWNDATIGRVGSVFIFTVVMWIALLGHWRDEQKGLAGLK
jgi:hypothetical protein